MNNRRPLSFKFLMKFIKKGISNEKENNFTSIDIDHHPNDHRDRQIDMLYLATYVNYIFLFYLLNITVWYYFLRFRVDGVFITIG